MFEAYAERFLRSIKDGCLNRIISFGAIRDFVEHYHCERNHHGLDNQLIDSVNGEDQLVGQIWCRERLVGMLKYYYRDAA